MILYASNTDNLMITRRVVAEEMYRITVAYGQKVIKEWTEFSCGIPEKDNRDHARMARQWIIDNRWNGNV